MVEVIRMKVGQVATLGIVYKDAGGFPTNVDGPTAWSSASEALLVPGTDEAGNPTFTAVAPGTTQVSALADADMSETVRNILNTAIVEILPGEAVIGEINVISITDPAPAPEPEPEPAPVDPEPTPVEDPPVDPTT